MKPDWQSEKPLFRPGRIRRLSLLPCPASVQRRRRATALLELLAAAAGARIVAAYLGMLPLAGCCQHALMHGLAVWLPVAMDGCQAGRYLLGEFFALGGRPGQFSSSLVISSAPKR